MPLFVCDIQCIDARYVERCQHSFALVVKLCRIAQRNVRSETGTITNFLVEGFKVITQVDIMFASASMDVIVG